MSETLDRLTKGDPEPFNSVEDLFHQRNGWKESARQFHTGMEYYRGLLDEIGNIIGPEAYVSEDGSVQQDVIRAKLPELVRRLKNGHA